MYFISLIELQLDSQHKAIKTQNICILNSYFHLSYYYIVCTSNCDIVITTSGYLNLFSSLNLMFPLSYIYTERVCVKEKEYQLLPKQILIYLNFYCSCSSWLENMDGRVVKEKRQRECVCCLLFNLNEVNGRIYVFVSLFYWARLLY